MTDTKKKIWEKAKNLIEDKGKITALMTEAKIYVDEKIRDQPALEEFVDHVKTLVRMIQAHFSGYYRAFSTQSLLIAVFGILYFITPTDVIPDFIPVLGFTDDVTLIYYLVSFIERDIEAFKKWELKRNLINENNA